MSTASYAERSVYTITMLYRIVLNPVMTVSLDIVKHDKLVKKYIVFLLFIRFWKIPFIALRITKKMCDFYGK